MKYIALTIGPIYKTLQNAKKPKELFAASYLFSYIMKKIIEQLKQRTFVIPYIKDESVFNKKSDVGLFHDRFIFQSQDGDLKRLQEIIDSVLEDVAKKLGSTLKEIKDYMQINYIEKELANDANAIIELMPYLDTKELFFQVAYENSFTQKLKKDDIKKDNFLTENKDIIDDLKRLSYNGYYCIIHADGDRMGEVIKNRDEIENISKSLFAFCINSSKLIKEYGGQTIFAGGDDLMFIAPPISKDGEKTVFELCEEIEKKFEIKGATLSFGVAINYIKFPLYEALQNSRSLLFDDAKDGKKDNIAFCITKHSGQSFKTVIHKGNTQLYQRFLQFSNAAIAKEDIGLFLDSMHHKIETNKKILENIKDDKERLKNFFDNYFNESIHENHRAFFDNLVAFLHIASIKETYATLRFIKFIKGDKK